MLRHCHDWKVIQGYRAAAPRDRQPAGRLIIGVSSSLRADYAPLFLPGNPLFARRPSRGATQRYPHRTVQADAHQSCRPANGCPSASSGQTSAIQQGVPLSSRPPGEQAHQTPGSFSPATPFASADEYARALAGAGPAPWARTSQTCHSPRHPHASDHADAAHLFRSRPDYSVEPDLRTSCVLSRACASRSLYRGACSAMNISNAARSQSTR